MKLDVTAEVATQIIVDEFMEAVGVLERQIRDRIECDEHSYYHDDRELDISEMIKTKDAYKIVLRDYMSTEDYQKEFGNG